MGKAALKAVSAVNYVNAGTIEFLVDAKDFLLHRNEYQDSGRARGDRGSNRSGLNQGANSSCIR